MPGMRAIRPQFASSMKHPLWLAFLVLTASGFPLVFAGRGACGWWDKVWLLLLAVAAYSGVAARAGLQAARLRGGIVFGILAMAAVAMVLSGFPLGSLHFTAQAGPLIFGIFPLLLPVLLFGFFCLCDISAAVVFPYANRPAHAAWASLAFVITLANSAVFFSGSRVWWVWNPSGWPQEAAGAVVLGGLAFALSFVLPADSRMRVSRWSIEVTTWLLMNVLFLAARILEQYPSQ